MKFTDHGGIELHCVADEDHVRLIVRDTGHGIPAELLDSIFEPFVQGDQWLTRTAEGTGLGRAISRQLARTMGGDISVESIPGDGSTFILVVPRR